MKKNSSKKILILLALPFLACCSKTKLPEDGTVKTIRGNVNSTMTSVHINNNSEEYYSIRNVRAYDDANNRAYVNLSNPSFDAIGFGDEYEYLISPGSEVDLDSEFSTSSASEPLTGSDLDFAVTTYTTVSGEKYYEGPNAFTIDGNYVVLGGEVVDDNVRIAILKIRYDTSYYGLKVELNGSKIKLRTTKTIDADKLAIISVNFIENKNSRDTQGTKDFLKQMLTGFTWFFAILCSLPLLAGAIVGTVFLIKGIKRKKQIKK